MATFRKRKHLDGALTFQAIIRIRRKGRIVYRESKMALPLRGELGETPRRRVRRPQVTG
jgi:hypothetical protein